MGSSYCITCGGFHEPGGAGCARGFTANTTEPEVRDPYAVLVRAAATLARRSFSPDTEGRRVPLAVRQQIAAQSDQQGRLALTIKEAAKELRDLLRAEQERRRAEQERRARLEGVLRSAVADLRDLHGSSERDASETFDDCLEAAARLLDGEGESDG